MLIGEPARNQFDWNFVLFRIPVRISVWFWAAAFLLGQGAASFTLSDGSKAGGQGILIWTSAMFLSILIHELGHSLAFRHYGSDSHIVLYHFGGLAIPDRNRYGGYTAAQPNLWNDIAISAAGPAAQFLAAAIVIAALKLTGFEVPGWAGRFMGLSTGKQIPSDYLYLFLALFLVVSIFWAALNLLPVYPLDGGQISRNLFLLYSGTKAIQYSLMLSVATAAIAALYGFSQEFFMGVMFTLLAYSSYDAYRAYSARY